MASKPFWPGFRWRILAHEKKTANSRASYTGKIQDMRAGWKRHPLESSDRDVLDLEGVWEFDELVIDDWLHLEQMDERHWWMGLGNGDDYWHVGVTIDRDGKATVSMEKQ